MPIALSGIFGAMSLTAVNSWTNQPGGFAERGVRITSVDFCQVYFNHAAIYEICAIASPEAAVTPPMAEVRNGYVKARTSMRPSWTRVW